MPNLTFEQIQTYKYQFVSNGQCAMCEKPVESIWMIVEDGRSVDSFFRCSQHPPDFTHHKRKFYKLDEKEMFTFHIL